MLTFDRTLLTQLASTLERPRPSKAAAYEPISVQRLDSPVLDAVHRLVLLLDEPTLLAQLAPLI